MLDTEMSEVLFVRVLGCQRLREVGVRALGCQIMNVGAQE